MSNNNSQPLSYLKVFVLLVIFAALISLAHKSYVLLSNSSFKHSSFNLLILNDNPKLAHFDVIDKKITISNLSEKKAELSKLSQIEQSAIIGVLIDASIDNNHQDFFSFTNILGILTSLDSKNVSNLNGYDVVKMYITSKFIEVEKRAEVPREDNIFLDSKISNGDVSITVVNAAEVDGIGMNIATALKNVGYNVVAIETEGKGKSYLSTELVDNSSVGRLISAFRIPQKPESESSISDVTLVIGEDSIKQ